VRGVAHGRTHGSAVSPRPNLVRVTPRILSDEGVPRANLAYTTPRGAVCVMALTAVSSFIVRENGVIEPAHTWPLPIFNQLPFGADGVVAWGWNPPEPGYVMYREHPDAPAIVERLSFIPLWGAWWRDRLYLTTPRTGLGSWAPRTEPALALTDLKLLTIEASEKGLVLGPCERDDSWNLLRRRVAHAWHWRGDGPPHAVSLGPFGAATSRSTGVDGWTATAYAEADIVQLESADGRVLSMTCYYPFKVAWLGRSLLISTLPEDLLLFEDLVGSLSAAG